MTGRLAMAVFDGMTGIAGCEDGTAACWTGAAIAGAVALEAGWEFVFTVDMPLAFGAAVVAGATLLETAGWPFKLIVLVCKSRSGAAGMARLTD
ncbi:hypothetical protein GCM10010872_27830 [Dyella flava]|nr:hypothetical protein GCM10010872_27830 [Dyella flava]